MKNIILIPVLILLTGCGCFQSIDTQPVIDGALMKDQVVADYHAGVNRLLDYLEANGMPLETYTLYKSFFQQRMDAYERLSSAQVAALAELSEVSTTDILERVEVILPQVKELIEGGR